MNIFKILANGDGSINEANVSAFLGYLLDPKADHALGNEFLRRFLERLNDEEDNFEEEFYNLDYEIFYEQAFKEEENSKQIVDLVIVGYQTKMDSGKESLIHDFIANSKDIKQIYLIENKIRKGALTKEQLIKQYKSTIHQIPDKFGSSVTSIYLTPDEPKYTSEFNLAKEELVNSHHIHWKSQDEKASSIVSILYGLLEEEVKGKIEPLNEYTIHTIKAFCQFIENHFKSERQIEKSRKRREPGSFTNEQIKLNEESGIEQKLSELRDYLVNENPTFQIEKPDLSNPRHPRLRIKHKGICVSVNAGYSTRDIANVNYRLDKNDEYSYDKLKQLANTINQVIKKPESIRDTYMWVDDEKSKYKISAYGKINQQVRKAIEQINLLEQ